MNPEPLNAYIYWYPFFINQQKRLHDSQYHVIRVDQDFSDYTAKALKHDSAQGDVPNDRCCVVWYGNFEKEKEI